jgi:hypothetical protein
MLHIICLQLGPLLCLCVCVCVCVCVCLCDCVFVCYISTSGNKNVFILFTKTSWVSQKTERLTGPVQGQRRAGLVYSMGQ